MASFTTPSQSLYMKSTWSCSYNSSTGNYSMTTRTTQTSNVTFNFASIPAGSTIHSATMYATISQSPLSGAAVRSVNDGGGASTFNVAGHAVSIAAGTTKSYEFKFKANGELHYHQQSHTSAFTYTDLRIVVSYTPPYTAPTMGNVTLAGSTAIRYTAASAASAIAWTASNGSYNTIQSYNRQISVNGGGYTNLAFTSGGNVTANATPGGYHQYRVQAVGQYSSSGWAYSPVLYSYSAVSTPTNLTLSKATVYTNEVLTLSWSASSAGVGVNVARYGIQENSADKTTTTSTTYSLTAPATAGTYTYRVRAEGSVAGYDSSYTGTVTLTVIPRQSTYTLNKSTVALGDTITATIVPVDPAFTHQVTFVLGASTLGPYTIAAGDTTYPFLVPASTWGAQLPNVTSGTATCQMKTLNAGVQVGDIVNINFTVTVPSTFLPTFSAGPTVVQTGNPTGFTTSSWFIQGVTMPKISATAIGSNGSAITKYNFSIANGGSGEVAGAGAKSWTATTISTAGATVWTVVATDSRGRTVTATGLIDVTAYSSPSIVVNELYRTTAGGLASGDGTYYKVRATAAAVTQGTPLATNAITGIKVQHRLKGTTTWSTAVALTNNTLSAIQGGGLVTILDTWEVRISCRDKIKPSTDVYSSLGALPPAVRAWDLRNDRGALGRFAGAAKTFILPDNWTTNVDADKLDGYHASNATASIPISNGTRNIDLNADRLDGYHASAFATASHRHVKSDITDFAHSHGNITNDGKVGTTADLPLFTGPNGIVVARTVAEAAQIYQYTTPNILHNWDFRRPVNQRGVSGTISSGTYFFDRWIRHAGTVTVEDGYLTLGNAATIEQRIEGHDLTGETVTLSVRVGNDVYSGTAVFPASGEEAVDLGGFGAGLLGYHADYLYVRLTADGAQDIVSVKLEMGEQSTLHLDPPADYAVEELKCHKYFVMFDANVYVFGYTSSGSTAVICVPFLTIMHGTPTVNLSGFTIFGNGTIYGSVSFTGFEMRGTEGRFMFSGSGIGLRHAMSGYIAAGSYISSEL